MLKIRIKTRVWLLGLLFLGSLLLVFALQVQMSSRELADHRGMLEHLLQTERLARLVHEVQKERGLSTAWLASGDAAVRRELAEQRKATDFKLAEPGSAPEASLMAGLGAMRERIDRQAVSERESFDFYTYSLSGIFDRIDRLGLAATGHPLQSELIALANLMRAKEYLGQARATLLAMPGRADPAWHASMGNRFGLFEASLERFRKETNPSMRATLAGATGEAEMQTMLRLMRSVRDGLPVSRLEVPRQRWYEAVTQAINLLREVERYSLIELTRSARSAHDSARSGILLQRGGLILLSILLTWLAISSLRLLMQALESALTGARRAVGGRGEGRRKRETRDETAEISQSFGELLDMVDRLNVKASTDALTGALNRLGFGEIAGGELQRAQRYHRSLAMIIADLDHFKLINDRHGHAVGDRVLVEFSRLVRDNLRGPDIFARWGGEEFIILTPETSAAEAARLADKLRTLVGSFRAEGLPAMAASFGVAGYAKGDSLETLFAKADEALYRAKENGRNRVDIFEAAPAQKATSAASGNIRIVSGRA